VISDVLLRLRSIFRRDAVERDLDDELRRHFNLQVDRYLAAGLTREVAARRARLDIGGLDQIKEEHRDARGTRNLEDFWRDARVAIRMLRRAPLFTAAVIITVGLGVGVNTLVFSVVEALVLRPLPVEAPERVWFVQRRGPFVSHPFPVYRELRDRNRTFAALAGYRITMMHVETPQGPAHTWGYLATGSYFDLLGLKPFRGRFFNQSDDVAAGGSPYAVLSYDYWRTTFGAQDSVVGSTIRINREPYTVLGVAPPDFRGTEVFYRPAIWVPMMMQAQIEVGNPWLDNWNTSNTWVIGRLADGVTSAQATDDLNAILKQVASESRAATADPGVIALTRPGLVGDSIGGPARAFGLGLLVLAGLVLLAACANLAGGLAARGSDRQQELAIRIAIGAGPGRLMRQLLTETLVLVAIGGAAGTAGAALAGTALSRWQLPIVLPVQFDTAVDSRVLVFALIATVLTALGMGLGPALQAVRTDPNPSLKARDAWAARRWPLRDVLVSAQVAICVVLVAGSFVAGRSLLHALRMPLGLNPKQALAASFDLGLAGYAHAGSDALRRQIVERLLGYPGVQDAAYGNSFPLNIDQSITVVYPEGAGEPAAKDVARAVKYQVSPEFFRTLGIRILQGREFTWQDTSHSQRVAVVNEALARQMLGDRPPIGQRIRFGRTGAFVTVVGVVETGKYQSLTETATPAIFQPMLQVPNTTTVMLVRSNRPDAEMADALKRIVREADPALPLIAIGSVEDMLGFVRLPMQAAAIALGAFGVLATALAATGIYSIVAYAVSRRRRELAIRIALGAQRHGLVRLVLRRTFVLVAVGTVVGVSLAVGLRSVVASVLYMPVSESIWSWGTVIAFIMMVAAAACAWPAWRALRMNPAAALASE
jgi:predicted permease